MPAAPHPRSGLTVVVPCLNEAGAVRRAYAEIAAELDDIDDLEILLVDDGSTDDTLTQIKELAAADPRVRYLSLSRNFGLEAAQAAGFCYATRPWVAQLDCDLQNPPSEVRRLLAAAADGYDVVFGIRQTRHDPWWRRWASAGQHLLARRALGIALPPGASTFRVIRAGVAKTLAEMRLGHPYLIAMVPMVGARYACIPTEHRGRTGGRSRWRLSRLVGHSFELFFGYSWRPLNASYLVSVLGAAVAVLVAGLAAAGLLGATAASTGALVLAAVTLVSVALVGRYLQRLMLDQRRSRPYYIREANLPVCREDRLDGGDEPVPPPPPVPPPQVSIPRQVAPEPAPAAEPAPFPKPAPVSESPPAAGRRPLLVLGASEDQLPVYLEAKRRGLYAIAVDRSADRPALRYADEHLRVSTRDADAIAVALGERSPAGVVAAASDASLLSWHELTHRLRTPFRYPRAAAVASVDKAAFHEVSRAAGVTGYRWRQHPDPAELAGRATDVGFPLVAKPTGNSGSKGVTLVHAPEELPGAIAYAAEHAVNGGLLLEEYLPGRNLTIDVFMCGGEPAFAAVTEKRVIPGPRLLVGGHVCPAPLDDGTARRLVDTAARLCREVELTDGPADFDVILGGDGQPRFLEMNSRLCGNGLPLLMNAVYGVDTVAALLSLAVGEPPDLTRSRTETGILHILVSPLSTEGILSEVRGVEQVRAMPGVARCELYAEPGAVVHPFTQARYKLGYLVVSTPDLATSEARLADALAALRMTVQPRADGRTPPVEVGRSSSASHHSAPTRRAESVTEGVPHAAT